MKKVLFLTFLFGACPGINIFFIHSKVLIWDFGGVTFNPNKLGVAREIGLKHFLAYMFIDFQNPNIQKMLFAFLDNLALSGNKNYIAAQTAEGMPLPLIMCYWQAGLKSGPEIVKIANQKIKELKKIGYFCSDREVILVKRTIAAMFNPEILAKNIDPVPEGVQLLKECSLAKNKDGSKKNLNIGFSNWDPLSFDIFYDLNRDSFQYFDHIIISGHIKLIKPHRRAYQYVLNTLNLNPKECIMIDDQKINALGAKACGIKTILLKNRNYKNLRKKLERLDIL